VEGVRRSGRMKESEVSFQPSCDINPSFFAAGFVLLLKSRPDSSGRYARRGWGSSSDSRLPTPDF